MLAAQSPSLQALCQLIYSSERRERERPRRLKEREQKVRADKKREFLWIDRGSLKVNFTSVSCYKHCEKQGAGRIKKKKRTNLIRRYF